MNSLVTQALNVKIGDVVKLRKTQDDANIYHLGQVTDTNCFSGKISVTITYILFGYKDADIYDTTIVVGENDKDYEVVVCDVESAQAATARTRKKIQSIYKNLSRQMSKRDFLQADE